MPSIHAPGGAYHFREHKFWGARQEIAWRQKVKDYLEGSRLSYRERRSKVDITADLEQDYPPSRYGRGIIVGERWGERGRGVDEYLTALSASPELRVSDWNITTQDGGIIGIIRLEERRKEDRQHLQYHFKTEVSYSGSDTIGFFYKAFDQRRGSFYAVNTLRTEETREGAWRSLTILLSSISVEMINLLRQWERKRLQLLREVGVESAGAMTGTLPDYKGRFEVRWALSHTPYEPLTWESVIGMSDGIHTLICGNVSPVDVSESFRLILDTLPLANVVSQAGLRRIIDQGDD